MNEHQKISPDLAFISIGSNIEPEEYLPRAIQCLHELGRVLKTSKVYQNPALGRPEQSDFLNTAVLLETRLQPLEIRKRLREIEVNLNRIRTDDKYAPRTIDLDLCLLGERTFQTPEFTLPDPDIPFRAHLAIPLSELDPNFVHPLICSPLSKIAEKLKPGSGLTFREDVTLRIREAAKIPPSKPATG